MAVLGPDELRADPHLAARDAIVTVEHPEVGAERHAGCPVRFSRTPAIVAPLLGEHTVDVLGRVLGLSADEVARLVAEGVCR
jgi:formyl-CoA transferase